MVDRNITDEERSELERGRVRDDRSAGKEENRGSDAPVPPRPNKFHRPEPSSADADEP